MSARPIIVTAAFPFVPATLSVAHVASTYLPSDITARLLRMLGHDARLATAVDVHSVQISRDGRTREGSEPGCARAEREYYELLGAWAIQPEVWFRTDEADHVEYTKHVFDRLAREGALFEKQVAVAICPSCGAAVPRRLATARTNGCPWCEAPALGEEMRSHFHLSVEPYRQAIAGAAAGMPSGTHRWLAQIMEAPLAPWCATRDNHVGIPLPSGDRRSLYLWFDSLVGYLTIRRRLTAAHSAFDEAEILQFYGKNILYHHGIVQPALFAALGIPLEVRASVRGFLLTPAVLAPATPGARDAMRMYLTAKVFDGPRDFMLSEAEFAAFMRDVVHDHVGNLLRRCALQVGRGPFDVTAGRKYLDDLVDRIRPGLSRDARLGETRRAFHRVLETVKQVASTGQQHRWLIENDARARGIAAGALVGLLSIIAPFAPEAVSAFNVFAGWRPGRLDDAAEALVRPLIACSCHWPL